jgi:hypothetical protein
MRPPDQDPPRFLAPTKKNSMLLTSCHLILHTSAYSARTKKISTPFTRPMGNNANPRRRGRRESRMSNVKFSDMIPWSPPFEVAILFNKTSRVFTWLACKSFKRSAAPHRHVFSAFFTSKLRNVLAAEKTRLHGEAHAEDVNKYFKFATYLFFPLDTRHHAFYFLMHWQCHGKIAYSRRCDCSQVHLPRRLRIWKSKKIITLPRGAESQKASSRNH